MATSQLFRKVPAIKFEHLNWIGSDALSRDQAQSGRLHEPAYRVDSIDPMTGNDIKNVAGHPCLEDGELTIYFETEATRKAYVDLPVDHPNRRLPYPAAADDDRGG